jgi:hypothetical protein
MNLNRIFISISDTLHGDTPRVSRCQRGTTMDAITRRHRNIVRALLFGLAIEELTLYSQSYLAMWIVSLMLFGLIYWLIMFE